MTERFQKMYEHVGIEKIQHQSVGMVEKCSLFQLSQNFVDQRYLCLSLLVCFFV